MQSQEDRTIGEVVGQAQLLQRLWKQMGLRRAAPIGALVLIVALFLFLYRDARRQFVLAPVKTQLPSEDAIGETTRKEPNAAAPATPARVTIDMIASPPRSVTSEPAALRLTTTPAGATFAIYHGIIANKTAPAFAPLRSGISPAIAEDLSGGNYTIFFGKDGWPDGRTEVLLQAGEVLPVAYAFPHGEATITSVPNGAEIFLGAVSLGFTPLTVDLPSGEQALTARLENYPDRTQNVSVNENGTPTIEFQMRARRHSAKPKPTPPPSLIERVGGSFKNLFGGNPTPPPRRKR